MRQRVPALCLSLCFVALSPSVFAAPAIEKERVGPVPTESSLSRDEALQVLGEGEQLLQAEQIAEGLAKMLEAYVALESLDGADARGVKELRSWLVKALEAIDLTDEAAALRGQGSYVDHPLSVMPSTWFPAPVSEAQAMNIDQAVTAVERGLNSLQQGDIDGLPLLISAYEILERELGAESADAKELRTFLVGLLETGGFTDEANALRARGSVTPATQDDVEVYTATWLRIIEAAGSADSVLGGGSSSTTTEDESPSDDNSSSDDWSSDDDDDDDDSDDDSDYEPKVVEPGSIIPGVLIDFGVGSFSPEYGPKGLIWSLGISAHWTLFRAKFFAMQVGGGTHFGRNRDERWLADVHGELRLDFDFQKVYLRPEFGGGYDQLAGGDQSIAVAYHVQPDGYYHFGGTLGVRFGERFGLYGRAVRLNRAGILVPNETRVRAGFLAQLENAVVDLAFVFTDYDTRSDVPGARIYSANFGLGF